MARWDAIAALCILVPLGAKAYPAAVRGRPTTPIYAAAAPDALGAPSRGWGVHASINGRALDLDSPELAWGKDRTLAPNETEAGLGWRGRRALVVLGYGDFDRTVAVPDAGLGATEIAAELRRREGGVLGLNLVLRMR